MKNLVTRSAVALAAWLAVCGFASPARAKLVSKTVTFNAGQVVSHSFLVYADNLKGRRPGVLVVPEFWGLNDYAKTRVKMLAQLGYVALAVDMYGTVRSRRIRSRRVHGRPRWRWVTARNCVGGLMQRSRN